jgi:hypothetical protein
MFKLVIGRDVLGCYANIGGFRVLSDFESLAFEWSGFRFIVYFYHDKKFKHCFNIDFDNMDLCFSLFDGDVILDFSDGLFFKHSLFSLHIIKI